MLFLIPIVAGAAAWLNRDRSGSFSAIEDDRKINCYEIWDQVTHGAGPSSIGDGQRAATRLKASYHERLATIDRLSREMDAAWRGAAAAAAQDSGAHPLRVWMEDSAKKLSESEQYLGQQHGAFSTVAAQVQQVPEKPPHNNFLNSITPWETDTDRAIKEYNRNGQANVDAFTTYFTASNDNAKGLPTYSAVGGAFQNVGVVDDDKEGKAKNDKAKNDKVGGDKVGGDKVKDDGPGNSGHLPGNIPGRDISGSGGHQPGTIPDSGGHQPGTIPGGGDHQPGRVPGTPGGYPPPSIPGRDGTRAAAYTPPQMPGSDLPGAGFGPGGSGVGGFGGDSRAGGGFGPGGPGGAGVSGLGPDRFAPGASTGAAILGSEAGTRAGSGGEGTGTGTGRGNLAGMGGMGSKGGKGGEDDEHAAKYLVSDDPNDLFGTDELTAPPVIGE